MSFGSKTFMLCLLGSAVQCVWAYLQDGSQTYVFFPPIISSCLLLEPGKCLLLAVPLSTRYRLIMRERIHLSVMATMPWLKGLDKYCKVFEFTDRGVFDLCKESICIFFFSSFQHIE